MEHECSCCENKAEIKAYYCCEHIFCTSCLSLWTLNLCCPICASPKNAIAIYTERNKRIFAKNIKRDTEGDKKKCILCNTMVANGEWKEHQQAHEKNANRDWEDWKDVYELLLKNKPVALTKDTIKLGNVTVYAMDLADSPPPPPDDNVDCNLLFEKNDNGEFEWRNEDTILMPGIMQKNQGWIKDTNTKKWLDLKVIYKTADLPPQRLFCSKYVTYEVLQKAYANLFGTVASSLVILHRTHSFPGKSLAMKCVCSGDTLLVESCCQTSTQSG